MKLENRTDQRRWYDDACGTAHALELVGERWALLIVRELMFGPRRFGALRAALPGISANVLTQRLAGLERAEILARRKLPAPASVQVYELTDWGYESEPIFQAMGRWAVRSPGHDPSLPLSAASLMLSFRTMYAPAEEFEAEIGFRLGEDGFVAHAGADGIAIRRAEPEDADVLFVGAPEAIAGIVYGGLSLANAEAAKMVEIAGNREVAARFTKLFPLPPKIGG